MKTNSNYIIYIDESGDHGLGNIDKDYPVFVLSFCCFEVGKYTDEIVPLTQRLKFKYFGHDQIILHEHHIRKQKGDFAFLRTNAQLRNDFLQEINNLISKIEVDVFAMLIDKNRLKQNYSSPHNPYNLGMRFGLERLLKFLQEKGEQNKNVYFVFEKRGQKEDRELELEFRRICDGVSDFGYKKHNFDTVKFIPIFADKKSNSAGLQIADLTARPIGINYLRPKQNNRAYEIIKDKIKSVKVFP